MVSFQYSVEELIRTTIELDIGGREANETTIDSRQQFMPLSCCLYIGMPSGGARIIDQQTVRG